MECKRCKVDKSLNGSGRCGGCEEYVKKYYKEHRAQEIARATKSQNRDRTKTNQYKRELTRKNPIGYMIQRIRSRAKLNNIPFDLTKEDIVIPSVCPVLGIPLQVSDGKAGPNSISLDRINPELGYIRGNIVVISHKANTIKSDATLLELEKVLIWLKTLQRVDIP